MYASDYQHVRGDGSIGQIENISLGIGQDGHTYAGYVHYYAPSAESPNAPFQIIFSGVDGDGVLHIYGSEYVADFATHNAQHNYSFTYVAFWVIEYITWLNIQTLKFNLKRRNTYI